MEEEGIAELVMGDTGIADVASEPLPVPRPSVVMQTIAGPGTSLKRPPGTSSRATSQGVR